MTLISFFRDHNRFLLFGMLMTYLSSFGQTYMFGAFKPALMESLSLNDASFGLWYLIITLGSAFGLNFLGGFIDRMPLSRWTMIVLISMIFSLAFLWLGSSFIPIILAMLAVRLIGQGLLVHIAATSMTRYFEDGRGKAISIALLGIPLGQATLPYAATLMQASMNWQLSWFILGAGLIILSIPLVHWLLHDHHHRHHSWLEQTAEHENKLQGQILHFKRKQVLRDYKFYLFIPNLIGIPFWVTAVFFFASDIAAAKKMAMTDFTALYLWNGVSAIVAPFIVGSLVDKYSGKPLLLLATPIMVIAMLLCIYMETQIHISLFFFILGFCLGASVPVNNSVLAELYGTKYLGEIKSLTASIIVVSTALSPWLIGIMLEQGWSIITLMWGGVLHAIFAVPLLYPIIKSKP